MIAYDAAVKQIGISINEAISEQVHLVRQMNNRLFDLRCCPEIGCDSAYNSISFPVAGILLTYDDKVLAEYYNNVLFARRMFNVQRIRLAQLKDQNTRLQALLKNKYSIE
jgi:hypothetical protein